MCKKNCLDCQFFCGGNYEKTVSQSVTVAFRESLRLESKKALRNRSYFYNASWCCYKQCWHANDFDNTPEREECFYRTITQNRSANNSRGNSCFYREFQEGMFFSAAEELEKRETIQKETAADRKWIKRGVWATFGTALATLLAAILEHILNH